MVFFGSFILSHKIAGPIYNLKRCMNKVAEGDLTTRMKLRNYDEFKNLEQAFNYMVENLQIKTNRISDQIDKLENLKIQDWHHELKDEIKKRFVLK